MQCLGKGPVKAAIAQHLAKEAGRGFRGVVAVDAGSTTIRWASDGYDVGKTRFWIASISKALTATAAMRLAERGQVSLDAKVGDVFPQVTGELRDRTLRQLLAHRAGLKHLYAADGVVDRAQAVAAISHKGAAGTSFLYSNDGYSLAAAMLEQITGNPFEKILADEIFAPADMATSGVWGPNIEISEFASFPTNRSNGMMKRGRPIRNYGQLGPSGVYSTAIDLQHFLKSLRENKLLSAKSRVALWTPGWSSSSGGSPRSGTSYGLGWGLTVERDVVTQVWHGGDEDWLHHNGQIKRGMLEPYDIVVLSNAGSSGQASWSSRVLDGLEACLAKSESQK